MRGEVPIDETVWNSLVPESRQRLLFAALDSFAERGYHGTTTRDISARANLSSAAIYMHFKSKAQLLQLIMRTTHEEILRDMQKAALQPRDPLERLKAIVRAHVRFHANRHTAARVANHELPALAPRHRAYILDLRRQIEDVLETAIKQGVASGDFELRDTRATMFAILSLGIGVSRWFVPGGRLTPDELADIYAEDVARMLRPNANASPSRTRGPASHSRRESAATAPALSKHLSSSIRSDPKGS